MHAHQGGFRALRLAIKCGKFTHGMSLRWVAGSSMARAVVEVRKKRNCSIVFVKAHCTSINPTSYMCTQVRERQQEKVN